MIDDVASESSPSFSVVKQTLSWTTPWPSQLGVLVVLGIMAQQALALLRYRGHEIMDSVELSAPKKGSRRAIPTNDSGGQFWPGFEKRRHVNHPCLRSSARSRCGRGRLHGLPFLTPYHASRGSPCLIEFIHGEPQTDALSPILYTLHLPSLALESRMVPS